MKRPLVALGAAALVLTGCSNESGPELAAPATLVTTATSPNSSPSTTVAIPQPASQPAPDAPDDRHEEEANLLERTFGWLSRQPNWVWLLLVAVITHRLTLRREKWNREQARRSEQRTAIADFSAAVNGAAPVAADLATWLQRHRTSAPGTQDRELAAMKIEDLLVKFSDKVFEIYRASDLLGMTLVDPELLYRATFAVSLSKDIAELGGHRERDPLAQQYSYQLLEVRCTERMRELLLATGELLNAAMPRIQPQTSWWSQRVTGAHYRRRKDEVERFVTELRSRSADLHEKTATSVGHNGAPAKAAGAPGNRRRSSQSSAR
ncbi:hypothetical protein [Rhodococcus ruber]|uniref:hypothetical protein n=1 Tax=Rhodococcus ruber TaxID=1830 RepID=UPI001F254A78|nr:hypothetical protein [Rhodococcus ruber]MCF8786885.1 hypothetical protein [Rhodococcus ruber]